MVKCMLDMDRLALDQAVLDSNCEAQIPLKDGSGRLVVCWEDSCVMTFIDSRLYEMTEEEECFWPLYCRRADMPENEVQALLAYLEGLK